MGNVLVPFKTSPRTVNFGKLTREAGSQTKTVTITRGDGGPLQLELLPTSQENLTTELREIEPGEKYELDVTIQPPWPNNRFRSRLTLATGVPEGPRSSISLYAQITPRLVVKPSRFTLPNEFDQGIQRSANLVWDDNKPHPIRDVTVNDPELSVTLDEANGRQRLVLDIPAGYQRKPGARYVMVRTDDKAVPSLKVPVTFARKGRPNVTRTHTKPGAKPAEIKRATPRKPQGTSARRPSPPPKPPAEEKPLEEKKPPEEEEK